MTRQNISFAGAGRVAVSLCREIYSAGFNIDLVVSESENSARSLADSCKAPFSTKLVYPDTTEIIIVAVPDHSLKIVLEKIKCHPGTLVAHTAGSIGIDVFPEHIKNRGIFYPLQTFSKQRKVAFKDLPFLLESSDDQSSATLKILAEAIGGKVHFVNSEDRRMLHLAAVFVCNFTNHMLTAGQEVARRAGFSLEVLAPLIEETISKAMEIGPDNAQTGPAVRNDKNTIEKHLELLSFSSELQRVYSELTRSITEYYKNKN